MPLWIDTHCHLDAAELAGDPDRADQVRARARAQGVVHCTIPAVGVDNFTAVHDLAHRNGDSYALGIHPLFVPQADDADLHRLDRALADAKGDPRLVAVGEIGLDFFVPDLCAPAMRERQERFYLAQLQLACQYDLPVILHVRRSADRLLRGLRAIQPVRGWCGIAHAFAGSRQQADAFVALGFKLGFGGAVTFDRALQLRRLVVGLPLSALVLETDAPDIPPHWLYLPAIRRAAGEIQPPNEPAQLPAIAQVVAELRGITVEELAQASSRNACAALPKLAALLV